MYRSADLYIFILGRGNWFVHGRGNGRGSYDFDKDNTQRISNSNI